MKSFQLFRAAVAYGWKKSHEYRGFFNLTFLLLLGVFAVGLTVFALLQWTSAGHWLLTNLPGIIWAPVPILIIGMMMLGVTRASIHIAESTLPSLRDFWSADGLLKAFIALFVYNLVAGLAQMALERVFTGAVSVIAIAVMTVAGVFLYARFCLAGFYIADDSGTVTEAFVQSWKATRGSISAAILWTVFTSVISGAACVALMATYYFLIRDIVGNWVSVGAILGTLAILAEMFVLFGLILIPMLSLGSVYLYRELRDKPKTE